MKNQCKNCNEELPLDAVQVGGVHMHCEQEYFHEKNQVRFKIRPKSGGSWLVEDTDGLLALLRDSESGEPYIVQAAWFSKAELEAMPEFKGW